MTNAPVEHTTATLPDSAPHWNVGGLKNAHVGQLKFAIGTAGLKSVHVSPVNFASCMEILKIAYVDQLQAPLPDRGP